MNKIEPIRASELETKVIPPTRWAVPGLIPEGVTVIAGKPKLGKSFLALNICIAVALGKLALGSINVEKGEVLYLALEDTQGRLKKRILQMRVRFPQGLYLLTELPRWDQGGRSFLEKWLSAHSKCRLVVIDTLSRFRPLVKGRVVYEEDVKLGSELQQLSNSYRVAIIVITHTRKTPGIDTTDEVAGTTGLTGSVDTVAVFNRGRTHTDAILTVTGREVEERELALRFRPKKGKWKLTGDAYMAALSKQRKLILKTLKDSGPHSPKEIAEMTGLLHDSVRHMVRKLYRAGLIIKDGVDNYEINPLGSSND